MTSLRAGVEMLLGAATKLCDALQALTLFYSL